VSIISTRFDQALRAQIVQQARTVIDSAQARTRKRLRRRVFLWLALPVALGGLVLAPSEAARPRSRVAFAQGNVISAESQGLGGGVEELLPPSPPPVPGQGQQSPISIEPEDLVARDPEPTAARPLSRQQADAKPCATCGKEDAATAGTDASHELATEELLPETEDVPAEEPRVPTARVLNMGSRFDAVLDLPTQTGAAGAPVAAVVAADVSDSHGVVLPAGARVVGEAFATTADDRVHMAVTAVVIDGKTIRLHGLALGPDGTFGVAGKVVRKGSKKKAGAGRVLGAVGSAISFGLIGGRAGLIDSTAAEFARDAGRSLSGLEAAWQRSDKVVRVPAGTRLTIYVREDATF
jgi:Bacterial conjugation TrbI-like protein